MNIGWILVGLVALVGGGVVLSLVDWLLGDEPAREAAADAFGVHPDKMEQTAAGYWRPRAPWARDTKRRPNRICWWR